MIKNSNDLNKETRTTCNMDIDCVLQDEGLASKGFECGNFFHKAKTVEEIIEQHNEFILNIHKCSDAVENQTFH